jgi:hypothetical protein
MGDDDPQEEQNPYQIDGSMGNLSLTVTGEDKKWVEETFQKEWSDRLMEYEAMRKDREDGGTWL